jgi:type IV secretory pathway TraG/TraD family ATPase VirD4
LDPLALRENAAAATSLLFTDFGHYISRRKDSDRPCVLFIDEFSSIARRNDIAFVTEQARSFNVGLVLIPQSLSGLGDEEQRDRILDSVETVIAHSCRLPDRVSALGGERRVAELTHHFGEGLVEGKGNSRLEVRPKVEPQDLRTLAIGEAWVMRRGQASKVRIHRSDLAGDFEVPCEQNLHPEPSAPEASAVPKELSYLDD